MFMTKMLDSDPDGERHYKSVFLAPCLIWIPIFPSDSPPLSDLQCFWFLKPPESFIYLWKQSQVVLILNNVNKHFIGRFKGKGLKHLKIILKLAFYNSLFSKRCRSFWSNEEYTWPPLCFIDMFCWVFWMLICNHVLYLCCCWWREKVQFPTQQVSCTIWTLNKFTKTARFAGETSKNFWEIWK